MSWNKSKLKDLLTKPIQNGYSPLCPEEPTGKWILGLGALTGSGLDVSQVKPAPINDGRINNFLLSHGDFLVSRSNTLDKVGRSALFKNQISNCYYPDLMMRFRVDTSKIHPEFLEIYLTSIDAIRHFQRHASGTSGSMVKINKRVLENLIIPLPSMAEQKEISESISIWSSAIEKTERLIAAKDRLYFSLIQTLINQHCDEWEHLQFNKIFDTVTEKSKSDCVLLSVTQDRGVIPRSMLKGRVMSPEGSTDSYKFIRKGDFAISLRSFQGGIEYSLCQGIISPAYTVLRAKLKINDDFYKHFFKSYLFIEKYLSIAVIGIRDGKQISIPNFMTVKIPYPPLELQMEIAETLNAVIQEITLLRQQLEAIHKQKCGLMQKLLTGQWRIKISE